MLAGMASSHSIRYTSLLSPFNAMVLMTRAAAAVGLARPTLRMLTRNMVHREHGPLKRYQPTQHDVFVATYAKSGTNWAMQICQQIAHRGAAQFEHIHDVVCWPEAPFIDILAFDDLTPQRESPTGLRVIKTHLPASNIPYSPQAKYVTIIRDPKDMLISAYFFMLGLLGIRHRVSVAQWLQWALEDESVASLWATHTAGYWARREHPNVFVRTFSEVKHNLPTCVAQIAAVMGVELTPAQLEAVVERSSYTYMRAHKHQFAAPFSRFSVPSQYPDMVRSGQTREAHKWMDDRMRAAFDQRFRRELRELNSDFPYDEVFAEKTE